MRAVVLLGLLCLTACRSVHPAAAPLPTQTPTQTLAQRSANPLTQPPQLASEQDLLNWRIARAAERDPARRAELDLAGAQLLWRLQGPGAARTVYEELALQAPPAQAAQACAQLGALELEQGRAGAALAWLERALSVELPAPLGLTAQGNRALAAAVLEATPARLAALDAAAQALEAAGDAEGAAALRRNRARLEARR
ncbi:MAG: hypothetical protein RL277_837 [Planctomycetota bacterium]|jgi:hypothetical protein